MQTEQRKQYLKRYYQERKAEYAKRNQEWQSKNRARRVAHTLKCRAKNPQKFKEYQRVWREKNKSRIADNRESGRDKMKEYLKAHYRKNKHRYIVKGWKRRALKKSVTVDESGISAWCQSIKSQEMFQCCYCKGVKLTSELHFDHVVPLSRGGKHSLENLAASCSKCNRSKADKTPSEWMSLKGSIEI